MRILGYEITKAAPQTQPQANKKGLEIKWMGGSWIPYEDSIETYIKEGILRNPHVSAIVSRIIDKAISVPWYAYAVKDTKKLSKYESMTGGDANEAALANARIIKSQALSELPDNHAVAKMLKNPNSVQGFTEFIAELVGYDCLSGEQIVAKQGVSFSEKGMPLELYALPPHLVTFVADSSWLKVKAYKWQPENIDLDPENVVVGKRWNPIMYDAFHLRGLSPLRAMLTTLQGSNEALDTMRKMFVNMGPPVVVYPDSEGIIVEKKANDLKESFRSYIMKNRKGEIMVNSGKLGKLDLGVSPVDLAILDSDIANRQNLCNAFGVDSLLFGNTKDRSGTAAELEYARKRMVLDAVLPILVRIRGVLNKVFEPTGAFVDFDYSGLPEMQVDMKAMAETLGKMPYVTYQEKREFTGWTKDERTEYQDLLNDYAIPNSEKPYLMAVGDAVAQDSQNNGTYQ
jgi:HK97 family phage portal protein